jgi:hypothetical protein
MQETTGYFHLATRDGSAYRQYFVKGRSLRAETLFRATVGPEPTTPEEAARDDDVSVEVVREAIEYRQRNRALLKKERDEDWTDSRARGLFAARPVSSETQSEP